MDAGPLTDAGLTPYHATRRSRHLLAPGSTAVVIGVVRSDLGVQSCATAADEIREATRGRGADLALDCVGVDATLALGAAVARAVSGR